MCPQETSFIPVKEAAIQTLGAGYGDLAQLLLSPSNPDGRLSGSIATMNELLFSSMTLDGSITTPPTLPKPGLITNLSDAFNRPIHPAHPNLAYMREGMPVSTHTHLLNAHLTRQVIPDLLSIDAQMHLPTLNAMMGKNADIVTKTNLAPDLVMSLYYQFLCGYLTAYNESRTLSLSVEDLGRLSVIRIKDLEHNASQGITFSFFREGEPDNWSTVLSHRAKYQRVKVESSGGIIGFEFDPKFYSSTGRMEYDPGSIDWWTVFVARLARTWADQGFSTDNIDLDSLERYRPKGGQKLTDPEAIRHTTANLTVADAYNESLTKDLVRATNMSPLLRQNTTANMRRSLLNADKSIFNSRSSRQGSLINSQLVDSFTRYMPAKLDDLKTFTRESSNRSGIKQCVIIEPYERGRAGNNFMFLRAQGTLGFLLNTVLADKPVSHGKFDYLFHAFSDLIDGAHLSTV